MKHPLPFGIRFWRINNVGRRGFTVWQCIGYDAKRGLFHFRHYRSKATALIAQNIHQLDGHSSLQPLAIPGGQTNALPACVGGACATS